MSDDRLAHDIARVFREEAAPEFAEAFHPDEYEVVRDDRTPDGRGGETTTEVVVEDGPCLLDIADRTGEITLSATGAYIRPSSPYRAELPLETTLRTTDTLRINGRDFTVVSPPRRGGDMDMFTIVDLEDRGEIT